MVGNPDSWLFFCPLFIVVINGRKNSGYDKTLKSNIAEMIIFGSWSHMTTARDLVIASGVCNWYEYPLLTIGGIVLSPQNLGNFFDSSYQKNLLCIIDFSFHKEHFSRSKPTRTNTAKTWLEKNFRNVLNEQNGVVKVRFTQLKQKVKMSNYLQEKASLETSFGHLICMPTT